MTPHGPDTESYEKAVKAEDKPFKIGEGNYSFMFESGYMLKTTCYAFNGEFAEIEKDYSKCWDGLKTMKFES